MALIKLSNEVFVNPDDVCSVEKNDRHDWKGSDFSGYSVYVGPGTRLILKNGQKVYVPIHIDEVIRKLGGKDD